MMQWTLAQNSSTYVGSLLIGFLVGAVVCSFFVSGVVPSIASVFIALVLAALSAFSFIHRSALLVAVFLLGVALSSLRMTYVTDPSVLLAPHFGKTSDIVGVIRTDPEVRQKNTQLVVDVSRVGDMPARGQVLVIAERVHAFSYKDEVLLRGEITAPQSFTTETGDVFDYKGYLAAKGVGGVMFRPSVEVLSPASCCSLWGALYGGKHAFMSAIENIFPEPAGGLLEGMLLGVSDALPEHVIAEFRASSLVHIIVLSGYNLTMVALAFMWVLSLVPWIPIRARLMVGAIAIVLFAAMVGAGATVVRAACMALIALLAQALRRQKEAMRALLFAAACMVMHNPLIITNDPSFILSFLATFGLITLSEPIAARLWFIPTWAGVRDIAAATLATQLFILPALIFYTGTLSLVSLPANMLALPLVPYAMFFGAIAAGAQLLVGALAFPLMVPALVLLLAILGIAHVFATIPGAYIEVGVLQTPFIFLFYVVLLPLSLFAAHSYTKAHGRSRDTVSLLSSVATHPEA